ELRMPRAIAFAPDGSLVYVLDRTHRLQVFTPGGEFVREWATPPGVSGNPRGLDVAADGLIYVADTHNSQVVIYTPEGREVRRWGRRGARPGELAVVTGVAIDRLGRAWTCQYGEYADRVQLFDARGRFVRAAASYGDRPGLVSRP